MARAIDDLEARARLHPDDPALHYEIAAYYWNHVYRGFRLTDAEKKKAVAAGVTAADRAIGLRADYVEALVCKSLLLRFQAHLDKNQARQRAIVEEADRIRALAEDLRRKQAADFPS